MIDDVNTTTINQITQTNLRSTLAPIPPLAEQKRIVEKVDVLMTLCDQLEAQQIEREKIRIRLNDAALDRLVTASDPGELAAAWQRVRDNFDLLYAVPEQGCKVRNTQLRQFWIPKSLSHFPIHGCGYDCVTSVN
jgi:type I restriction enzyme S subunit